MESVPHGIINQSYKARNVRMICWVGSGSKKESFCSIILVDI